MPDYNITFSEELLAKIGWYFYKNYNEETWDGTMAELIKDLEDNAYEEVRRIEI